MGKVSRVILVLTAILLALAYQKFSTLTKPLPVPSLDLNKYWGRGSQEGYNEDRTLKPQEIFYEDSTIAALTKKLNDSITLHNPLEGTTHEYGLNANTVIDLVEYWRNDYLPRWPERQDLFNSVPHYQTQIQGLRLHFVHIKPAKTSGKKVLPLLLLHGWPGSIREFYDFFPLLTTPNDKTDYVFEVVAPSLPGFGWSEGSAKTGFGPAEVAVVVRNLMIRLGHKKFFVQGGDWGSIIGSNVATLFPDNVIGYHSNYCILRTTLSMLKGFVAGFYPQGFVTEPHHVSFVFPVSEKFKFLLLESGYFHIQATKPDTIGSALSSNPVGLAIYLYEKFVSFYPGHSIDAVLDNIMIYYLTNSITTSVRLYAESVTTGQNELGLMRVPTIVPTACARFVNDVTHSIDWQLKDKYPNLLQSTWHKKGGHFAAMEVPESLYKDFVEFIPKALSYPAK